MLKLTTDKHEASRGLSATAELLVISFVVLLALFDDVYCFMLYLFEQINQHREQFFF